MTGSLGAITFTQVSVRELRRVTYVKRGMWALTATVGAVVTIGGTLTGIGLASPSDNLALTNVPTANTKSDGYSPASRLSPELSQVVVA